MKGWSTLRPSSGLASEVGGQLGIGFPLVRASSIAAARNAAG
jgi:hypothetical protein